MKNIFYSIITFLFTTNLYSQCWKSIGKIDNDSVSSSFAIKEDGTLWAWGGYGLYGNGSQISSSVPIQVNKDTDWQSITYSSNSVKAIKSNGTLWAWGNNLGDGTKNTSLVPKQIGIETQWKQISVDLAGYTSAIKNNGTIWMWGGDQLTPIRAGNDTDWKYVFYPYAIKNNGTLWVASRSNDTPSNTYIQVGNENNFDQIDSKHYSSQYAIKSDGTLWQYASFTFDKPFNGNKTQVGYDNTWLIISSGFYSISELYSGVVGYGIKKNGSLWKISGSNSVQIGKDFNWKDVMVESSHITAIKTDGTLYTWGKNYFGQLGNGYVDDTELLLPTIVNTPGCLASVNDISMSEEVINVYPNPTDGILTIYSKDKVVENITIKNTEGRMVHFIQNSNGVIDIHKLDKGVYFLEWNENSNVKSKLIFKE